MGKSVKKRFIIRFVIVFLSVLLIQVVVLSFVARVRKKNKEMDAYIYGQSVADAVKLTLDTTLVASEELKDFYLIYGDQCFDDFENIAHNIAEDNPLIESLYIAPDAIIQVAYPSDVNEATIGFEMLKDPEQGPRAQLAIDTKKTTVAGPHELVEGGVGFIIRNPIFEKDEFVGFTILVLDWDRFVERVLENTSISSERYKFAVWKEDYDEHAVTDADGYIIRNSSEPISKTVDIEFEVPNDTWHLVVEPKDGWSVIEEMNGEILLSFLIFAVLILLNVVIFVSNERARMLQKEKSENDANERYMGQLSKALEDAERANNAKTVFLNNMSHDIRTPMNAILGYAQLMKREQQKPEDITGFIEKIEYAAAYLLSIINNVLDMARIESGNIELNNTCVDIPNTTMNLIGLFREDVEQKNLQFTNDISIEHPFIMTDEARMSQIFVNLISNAIKYTPEGGMVHMAIVEKPCHEEGYATYVVTVSDNGVGMSKEFQSRIFETFSREHTTTESKVPGTGLGMSIVKKLVDALQGKIEVESELGKGSVFRVTYKCKIADCATANEVNVLEKQNVKEKIYGKHILMAEDNDLNAEIAMTILQDAGFVVTWVKDGDECLNRVFEDSADCYDVILMDIQMPNLNGYETTKQIRNMNNPIKAKIPIIAMTANAFEEDRKKAYDSGMDGHLVKPIDTEQMIQVLASLFEERGVLNT